MLIRDWLRRKEIDGFAAALAEELGRRFPPKSEQRTDKGARNQLAAIAETLYARAAAFRRDKRLGVYGKAKLGNTFRWRLQELGYSDALIHAVTDGLVVRLSSGR